ncbi:hypothetical protein KVP09_09970 [Alcaligenaceae bacterium CGII-47]|nr:hypothetical protein [Alcaligenaceae bacterium CGII-47]
MTKKYKDSFCTPAELPDGRVIAGGAARNYRIGQYEHGLDDIIQEVTRDAAERAFARAEALRETTAVLNRVSRKKVQKVRQTTVCDDEEDEIL